MPDPQIDTGYPPGTYPPAGGFGYPAGSAVRDPLRAGSYPAPGTSACSTPTGYPSGDALLEPFNDFTTNTWTTATGTIVAGRTGNGAQVGNGAGVTATWTIPTASQSPYATVGFAVKPSALPAGAITVFRFASSGGTVPEVGVQFTNTGVVQIVHGSAGVLASSAAGVIVAGAFHYVELTAFNDDTAGYATVRVNGVQVATVAGVDTRNGGPVYDRAVLLGASSGVNNIFDDLYLTMGATAPFKGSITIP